MAVEPEAFRRRVALEGAFNFRDLGGYPGRDGHLVRTGRLFRSDGLGRLTDGDLEVLAGLQLATVIDLRTPAEIERGGRVRETAGLAYHHISMGEVLLPSTDVRWGDPEVVADHYLQMIDAGGSAMVEVLALVADERTHPVVFHCAAGKDRTGITAAVILALLGVERDTIVADYGLTHGSMQRWVAYWLERSTPERRSEIERHLPSLLSAREENIARLLDLLVERHGSVDAYAADIGAEPYVARLRDALLD